MTGLQIYFISIFSSLKTCAGWMCALLFFSVFVMYCIKGIGALLVWSAYDKQERTAGSKLNKSISKKMRIITFIVAILFSFVYALTPTTPQAVAIALVPKIVNNEEITNMPEKIAKFFNAKLDEWIIESAGNTKDTEE